MSADGSFGPLAPSSLPASGWRGEAAPGLVKDSVSQTDAEAVAADSVTLRRGDIRLHKMARSVRDACKRHASAAEESGDFPAMFTFTCRKGAKPEPRSIINAVECIKKWALRTFDQRVTRYVWVAELQAERARAGDAGAVHYHLVVWLPMKLRQMGVGMAMRNHRFKASGVLPKPDKKGWWKHGSTERDWVRCKPATYLAKYVSKGADAVTEGAFPRGLRTHAAGGFDAPQRVERAHWMLPKWMREQVEASDRAKRAQGGGFVTADGRRFASPWLVLWSGQTVRIVRRTAENAQAIARYLGECIERQLSAPLVGPQFSGFLARAAGDSGPDVPF